MADDVDRGNDQAEMRLQACIESARRRASHQLTPVGECYNCFEPVGEGRAFCCTECREDYDYRDAVRRNTGAK